MTQTTCVYQRKDKSMCGRPLQDGLYCDEHVCAQYMGRGEHCRFPSLRDLGVDRSCLFHRKFTRGELLVVISVAADMANDLKEDSIAAEPGTLQEWALRLSSAVPKALGASG